MPYKDKEKQRAYQKRWIAEKIAKTPGFKQLVVARRSHGLELRMMMINRLKADFGCYFCDVNDPAQLDFHHVDVNTKIMAVSEMVRLRYRISIIEFEITKCICVCKNHHASLTQLRADFTRGRRKNNMPRETVERRKRQDDVLRAEDRLRRTHPNIVYKNNPMKLFKDVFGT